MSTELLDIEKIKDVEDYEPNGEKAWKPLLDDARICAGWYATFLDPKKEIKFGEATIIGIAVKIYKEIARCKNLDPEKYKYVVNPNGMKPTAKKLWDKVRKKLTKNEVETLLQEESKNDKDVQKSQQGGEIKGGEEKIEKGEKEKEERDKGEKETEGEEQSKEEEGKYAEVKPSGEESGREITAEEVLKKFDSFLLRKPFIYLVGGLANQGKTVGDIDILIRAEEELPDSFKIPLEFRILRLFDPEDRNRIQFLYDIYHGPFTSHYEVADLKVEKREEFKRIEMGRILEKGSEEIDILEEMEKGFVGEDFPEEFEQRAKYFLEVKKAKFRLVGEEGRTANKEAKASMQKNQVQMFRRFYPQKTSVSALMAYRVQETYSNQQTLDYLAKLYQTGVR